MNKVMRRISATGLVAGLLLAAASAAAETIQVGNYHYEILPAPAWTDVPAPAPQSINNDNPNHLHLADTQFRFAADGTQAQYNELRVTLKAASALNDFTQYSIPFDPEYQQLQMHALTLTRDGQEKSILTAKTVKIVHREKERERGLYEGLVDAFFVFEDLRAGDTVDMRYTIVGTNPLFAGHRLAFAGLQWNLGVDRLRVRVLDERGPGLATRVINSAIKPQIKTLGKASEYVWINDLAKGDEEEPDEPVWYNGKARLQITDFKDWNEVARWANNLFVVPKVLPAELQVLVKQWREQGKTQSERVEKALRFVQEDIRYYGIEVNVNAFQPFAPEEVVRRRYGDCKDKALLLVTLLRAMGIEAHPVLVDTRTQRRLQEFIPTAAAFDHAIATAVVDGKRYWLDGTAQYQRGALSRIAFFDYGYGLVVAPTTRELTLMQAPDPVSASIHVEQRFEASSPTEPVLMKVTTRYERGEAERMRARLAQGSDNLAKDLLNYYTRLYPGTEAVGAPGVRDNENENIIEIEEQYKLSKFFTDAEASFAFAASGAELAPFSRTPSKVTRHSPLNLYYPITITQQQIFKLPPHGPLNPDNAPLTIEGNGIRYVRQMSETGDTFQITHQYTAVADSVDADKMAAYTENLRRMDNALWLQITAPKQESAAARERLQSLIQKLMNKKSGGQ